MIYAYLNEGNNNLGKKNSLITEKRLQLAATVPAAVCKQLQLLPFYFDVTPKLNMTHFFIDQGSKIQNVIQNCESYLFKF